VRISVVIPVRDGAEFIGEAIESSLHQSLVPIEVIVVDDGSQDESAEVARRTGAQVISQSHRGPGAARNSGAKAATGELVAFLDADDLMTPERLALQSRWLADHQDQLGIFGNVVPRQWGRGAWSFDSEPVVAGLLPSALTVRRLGFLATGGFDESLSSGELVDWLAQRRAEHQELAVLDAVVAIRRIHERNMTRDPVGLRGYLEVARRGVARHRGDATTDSGRPSQDQIP
jgi:glycosyltransferase involved in cell wall biosynthesis